MYFVWCMGVESAAVVVIAGGPSLLLLVLLILGKLILCYLLFRSASGISSLALAFQSPL